MFYETSAGNHGLPRDPFKACIVPRPIGWISTVSTAGVPNLAPYSFFNGLASNPPLLMFSSNGHHSHGAKDSAANAKAVGSFVANLATWELRDAMNESSGAIEQNEFELAGLTAAPSTLVKAPRVAESPINMECIFEKSVDLPSDDPDSINVLVIGRVIGIHIDESVLTDGFVDMAKLQPIARLGYRDYAVVRETFSMDRPRGGDSVSGL